MSTRQHINSDRLHRLSERLEELSAAVRACGQQAPPPELADDVAAGEVMLELADMGGDELARAAIEDARLLREAARTHGPSPARLTEGGDLLAHEVERIIRSDKQAA